ncbi:RNA-directed DNA polymerase [Spiribacter onubensis]|uniref:RNA-directed DNA polymerase n=1 Tax=Spiribacter onubensis TaxID=3122420 RepID=A0ABV3S6W4_9GAMM
MIESNPEYYFHWIQDSLKSKKFTTSKYEVMDRWDGKKMRVIYKLPYFPDRIIQHALVQVCEPFWKSGFIRDTFQSIVGRGANDARKRVEKFVKGRPGLFALKFDIHQYYPSINSDILKKEIRKKIKCKDTLWLIDDIIDSADGSPIGNYTSQYFGNINLSSFDWWMKQTVKPYGYFRYCDDIVVLTNSSREAHQIRKISFDKLMTDHALRVKSNWQIFPVDDRGIDFVGYVFRSTGTRIRKSIAKGITKKRRLISRSPSDMTEYQIANGMMSYWGWCKNVQAKKFWFSNLTDEVLNKIEISKESIKERQRCRLIQKRS